MRWHCLPFAASLRGRRQRGRRHLCTCGGRLPTQPLCCACREGLLRSRCSPRRGSGVRSVRCWHNTPCIPGRNVARLYVTWTVYSAGPTARGRTGVAGACSQVHVSVDEAYHGTEEAEDRRGPSPHPLGEVVSAFGEGTGSNGTIGGFVSPAVEPENRGAARRLST